MLKENNVDDVIWGIEKEDKNDFTVNSKLQTLNAKH